MAQIARVAREVAGDAAAACSVDVEVPPYKETFSSPEEFKENVTAEALRDVRRIAIRVTGPELRIAVKFRLGKRKEVALLARPANEITAARFERAMRTVSAAIDRGRVWRGEALTVRALVYVAIGAAGLVVGWFGADAEDKGRLPTWGLWSLVGVMAVIGAVVAGLMVWVRPTVEIAPLGQTRLWTFTRRVGPWLAALIGAGIGKLLFG